MSTFDFRPALNLSRHITLLFTDGTSLTTDTVPALGSLPGQILETQLPTLIGAGSSLEAIDAGTY
jgi:hypothetical protein